MSAKNGKFVEKNMGLTSPEAIGGIFCATDRHSDNQSHVLYSVCVCVLRARARVFRFLHVVGRQCGSHCLSYLTCDLVCLV